jgi:hypothetical protein
MVARAVEVGAALALATGAAIATVPMTAAAAKICLRVNTSCSPPCQTVDSAWQLLVQRSRSGLLIKF